MLGREVANGITDSEDHHDSGHRNLEHMVGRVRFIEAVFCKYEQRKGASAMTPIVGSGIALVRESADGWEDEPTDTRFVGYIVTVHPTR